MILFLDFETYYDQMYSLSKMTPAEYILDQRFETICLGVAPDHSPGHIVDGPQVGKYLDGLKSIAHRITTVTYNAPFDNSILAWRYGFHPGRMVDGLGMARALLGTRLRKLGLADVGEFLGLGAKGGEIKEVKGLHRHDLLNNPDLWDRFRAYCLNDTLLLRKIFVALLEEFPRQEFAVMDGVLRCCIEPKFHCDVQLLQGHLYDLREEKDRLCEAVGADKGAISGNASFLAMLKAKGVEIEYKGGKRGLIPAIAKTDAFMARLLEDEDPEIQCLAAARLGVKSTLEERRSERLISIASLPWPERSTLMPIPLRYSGAHTWRLSGDWKINMQNLPSARMGAPVLRKSLMAPPGQKVIVGDLAQIEARLVGWFCRSERLLDEFRKKRDPYSRLAEQIFGCSVDKETMNGLARHIGKAGILGCGYGMGPDKFYQSVLRASRSQLRKDQMEELLGIWTPELAEKSVRAYRSRYSDVRQMWSTLDGHLGGAWIGKPECDDARLGILNIGNRADRDLRLGFVRGPGGRELRYPDPKIVDGDYTWSNAGVRQKIYGANLLENIIQFLARVVMFDIAVRLKTNYGLQFIHQVHDELVFMVGDDAVDWATTCIGAEMRQPPAWCQDLPLDCDVGFGQRYGDCK